MAKPSERLEHAFDTVYVTLVSVVVALALEKLTDRVLAFEGLWSLDDRAILVWLQAAIVLLGTLVMWLLIVYTVFSLRWDPTVQDAAVPFLVLFVLSLLISRIGRGPDPVFFYLLALVQANGGVVMILNYRRAGRFPENEAVLRHSDYRVVYGLNYAFVILALATAVLLHTGRMGIGGAVGAAALLALVMTGLIYSFSRAWWKSVRAAEAGSEVG